MEMKVIMRNLNNSVNKFDYDFWRQMKKFKENGWDYLIPIALELNKKNLDYYEVS